LYDECREYRGRRQDVTDEHAPGATLLGYLHVLRRRIWVVVPTVLLVQLAAVFFTLRQSDLYEASAEVLLSRQSLAATLTDTPDPLSSQEPDRFAQTEADLARVPQVAEQVVRATGIGTPEQLLAASSVSPKRDSDLLVFTVEDGDQERAATLATAYASAFSRYRRELGTIAYRQARRGLEDRIATLRAERPRRRRLIADLAEKVQELRTLETLQVGNTSVVRSARGAAQVRPTPRRNGILGLALGLVLGIGLGFLRDALDTRVRSAEDVAEGLGLPLLARLPEPPRRLRDEEELVMFAEPTSSRAEAFRVLRTNVEFANLDRGARTIMVTSALEGEGKSTTVANLAIAFARAGKRVVLVDLDVRRPILDRFFQLGGVPGLTDVVLGYVELEDAIAHISVAHGERAVKWRATGNGTASVEGVVDVLPCGPLPPDAGEFVATQAITEILKRLRERYELVLVDSPPLLHVGDAMTLAARIDGLLLVSSLRLARRQLLAESRRILETLPAETLGVVVAAAQLEDDRYRADYEIHPESRPAREPVAP
jgi:Mrp family chromosome partitioning ATPase/capsular polysaccharide biosynthesis protein